MYWHKHLYVLISDTRILETFHRPKDGIDALNKVMERFPDRKFVTKWAYEVEYKGIRRVIQLQRIF